MRPAAVHVLQSNEVRPRWLSVGRQSQAVHGRPDLSSFHGAAQPRDAYELLRTSIELHSFPAPRRSRGRRLRTSGVGPNDIDIAQLQDTDSGSELIHMAETMLCKDGEQEALLHDGATEIGGRIPINTDGGLLATANRSARPGSDRCSNSCISFAAPPGTGRCPTTRRWPRTALRGARDRRGRNPQSVTAKRKDSPDDADDSRQRAEVDLDHHSRNSEKTPQHVPADARIKLPGGVFAALRRILGPVDYASVFEASATTSCSTPRRPWGTA
ncbi:hypothetical protein I553_3925 [Mycobacterium xenopi 4042]|uniref:Thiolase C-terminal domain-containing protein n=1 Tax=Mycobacterium xenopi 4042 TaxID=1299334 RepID=X8DBW3_MYCXE|nr:hypothetical protein I553_3925 [Mycobacterium xenopi 4042]